MGERVRDRGLAVVLKFLQRGVEQVRHFDHPQKHRRRPVQIDLLANDLVAFEQLVVLLSNLKLSRVPVQLVETFRFLN